MASSIGKAASRLRTVSKSGQCVAKDLVWVLERLIDPTLATVPKLTDDKVHPFQRFEGMRAGSEFVYEYETFEQFTNAWSQFLISDMRRVLVDRPKALNLLDIATRSPHGGDRSKLYNIQLAQSPTGTSSAAALRRLRDHAPELLAKVEAGELSVNAAAIEAGFRKKQVSVPVDDAEACVRRLLKHYDRKELIAALGQPPSAIAR